MHTYGKSTSSLGFTMMEVLGATGIVMLLTAVVGTSIMGVMDSSKDAAIERQLQTINSAYQAYLSAGGMPTTFWGSMDPRVAHEVYTRIAGVTRTENGYIGPFLTGWPVVEGSNKDWPIETMSGIEYTQHPKMNFVGSTGDVTFYIFPNQSIDILPTWGSSGFGSGFGSSFGSGFGSNFVSVPWYTQTDKLNRALDYLREYHIPNTPLPVGSLNWDLGPAQDLALAMFVVDPEYAELISSTFEELGLKLDPNTMQWVPDIPDFDYSGLPDPAPLVAAYNDAPDKTSYVYTLSAPEQVSLYGQLSAPEQAQMAMDFFNGAYWDFPEGWEQVHESNRGNYFNPAIQENLNRFSSFLSTLPDGYAGQLLNQLPLGRFNPNTGAWEGSPHISIARPDGNTAFISPLNINFSGINLTGFDSRNVSLNGANFSSSNVSVVQLNSAFVIDGTNLSGLNLIGLRRNQYQNVNFVGATLDPQSIQQVYGGISYSNLSGQNLSGVNFAGPAGAWPIRISYANLSNTGITAEQITLAGGDFDGNEWSMAGTDLSGNGITRASLKAAFEAANRPISDAVLDSILF
jgi:uncharacterized protein YjbI with pentapeptide repeats/type II secretory pathway pseudopilin PulG